MPGRLKLITSIKARLLKAPGLFFVYTDHKLFFARMFNKEA